MAYDQGLEALEKENISMLKNDNLRFQRKLKCSYRTKVGGKMMALNGWGAYHTDNLKYRKRFKTLSVYKAIKGILPKKGWINVSNNVTTAPPIGGAAWLRT